MATKRKKKAAKRTTRSAALPSLERGEAKLSNRPIWQGHLRLSLVSCPVALFNATSRTNDISFHLLNPETNNRIRMVPTDPDTGPVERKDQVKSYELDKNRYIIIEPDELSASQMATKQAIDID